VPERRALAGDYLTRTHPLSVARDGIILQGSSVAEPVAEPRNPATRRSERHAPQGGQDGARGERGRLDAQNTISERNPVGDHGELPFGPAALRADQHYRRFERDRVSAWLCQRDCRRRDAFENCVDGLTRADLCKQGPPDCIAASRTILRSRPSRRAAPSRSGRTTVRSATSGVMRSTPSSTSLATAHSVRSALAHEKPISSLGEGTSMMWTGPASSSPKRLAFAARPPMPPRVGTASEVKAQILHLPAPSAAATDSPRLQAQDCSEVVGIVITELEIVQIFDKDQCRGGPELRVWAAVTLSRSGAEPGQKARVRRLNLLTAEGREFAQEFVLFLRQLERGVDKDADENVSAAAHLEGAGHRDPRS